MTSTEKAAAALELLPEELRECAVAYLLEQAERYHTLKEHVAAGMTDFAEGRFTDWSFEDFLRKGRARAGRSDAG